MSCQTLNINQNTLNCMNWANDCVHESHIPPIAKLPFWFTPTKAGSLGDTQQTFSLQIQNGGKFSTVLSKQVRTHLACLQRQMKRNQMCPKTSEIRAQADVINLLASGKRSGWTHNCWPTIGWLIINCGWDRTVPVLTTQGWQTEYKQSLLVTPFVHIVQFNSGSLM